MAITYTQDDLDKLKEALLTGAEEVTIGDRRIRYRSQAHLQALIKMVQEQLDPSDSECGSSTVIQGTYNKGRV